MQYLVIIERAKNNYSAYVPDLPGCIATGQTKRQVEKEIAKAIEFHIEGLKEDGYKIPRPSTESAYVALSA